MKRFLVSLVALLSAIVVFATDHNITRSPDGLMEAFTRDNDLWIRRISDGKQWRLTTDGSQDILNGYASWVYYEEILGRASKYKAFWWSPDSRRIAFYRFDNSKVPVFPIYSPFGSQGGMLSNTRYPKAGQENPMVKIALMDVSNPDSPEMVWADFDEDSQQYFGIPFWSSDSKLFYVAREPRRQNQLELFAVDAATGKGSLVYKEQYETWLDWIDNMIFTERGLYMSRSFETGWQQIYFLSYDGKDFRRLSEGKNWDINLLKVDESKGDIWFTAKRDSRIRPSLYRLDRKGRVHTLTNPEYSVANVSFEEDGKHFKARCSNAREPWFVFRADAYKGVSKKIEILEESPAPDSFPVPEVVCIENDGFELYGLMALPKDFDPKRKYPVIMNLYGGPGTPCVRDRWADRSASDTWAWENGIITIVVDPRSSGENGRRGMDEAFAQMTVVELEDYKAWASWLQSLPFVEPSRIGVQGFSFGGTTTSMLVLRFPEYFCCGIAGGGVYDWKLYDSHYTERFMDTPEANPEGYRRASVISYKDSIAVRLGGPESKDPVLKLTHGTGDDNVHLQNTLVLCDMLQQIGYQFELMLYPDALHGYRGYQGRHSTESDRLFWTRHLLW